MATSPSPAVRATLRARARRLALFGLLVAVGSPLLAWLGLRASLPRLAGEHALPGLGAPVTVERDALGVPTLRAANRVDLARATGYVHAQERFFQMDLARRRAAGELAELLGPGGATVDVETRLHRFRTRARRVIEAATAEQRAVVEAYAAGVNAGLADLGARPPEYFALRQEPAPWRPEDTVLVTYSMFLQLNDERARTDDARGLARDLLPPALGAFLDAPGTEWDAPVEGDAFSTPPLPGPEVLDLRGAAPAKAARLASPDSERVARAVEAGLDPVLAEAWLRRPEPSTTGSNNWAVAGTATRDGRAIVADDMHLGLMVPNTWYRAAFEWKDAAGATRTISGVTLAGVPGVVVGSNGRVAWGFTNSYGDWSDLVELEPVPGDPQAYLTPEGPRRFEVHREIVRVKGAEDRVVDVRETIWGPVVDKDHAGRERALFWIAHHPEAANLRFAELEVADDLDQALAVAATVGVPPQNFVCADSTGRIGWTILGRIPRRVGFDGRLPVSLADGTRRYDGWLDPADYPRVVDPPSGRLWTANARVVSGEKLAKVGDSGYDLGARAGQIRDGLLAIDRATERDMLIVHLDDRALFLQRWHGLLTGLLTAEAVKDRPLRTQARGLLADWGARAAIDSVGYRLVRGFRLEVEERVYAALTAAIRAKRPDFSGLELHQREAALWRVVSERPAHLLPAPHASWEAFLLDAFDKLLGDLTKGERPLAAATWGVRNTSLIQHPLARAVPALSRFVDMPRRALPGDNNMPRVQGIAFGASQRLAVSPGRERDGYFHMPGGQSGHPLSPHYADHHAAWADGTPTPFLPGATIHTLRLRPPDR